MAACTVIATQADGNIYNRLWLISQIAAQAALAAYVCNRTVRLQGINDDRYALRRSPTTIRSLHTIDSRGSLIRSESHIEIDCGAYPLLPDEQTMRAAHSMADCYNQAETAVSATAVRSDNMPYVLDGDMGDSYGTIARELYATRIANHTKQSPLAWRLTNLRTDTQQIDVLQTVAKMSDFDRKHAVYTLQQMRRREHRADPQTAHQSLSEDAYIRGIGIALGNQYPDIRRFPIGRPAMRLQLDTEGRATIFCSSPSQPWGARAIWQKIVAEVLTLPPNRVWIAPADTTSTPDSGPSLAGRNIAALSRLIRSCALAIRRKRAEQPLPLEASYSYAVDTLNVVRRRSTNAVVVEIGIDMELTCVSIRGLWMALDAGTIYQPTVARATIERNILTALRRTIFGDRRGDPLLEHLPKIRFLPPHRGATAKPIGELAFGSVPAAYLSALSQAIDYPVDRTPADESYLRMIETER